MSNSLFMDESNGNGVYAAKPNSAGSQVPASMAAATTNTGGSINNMNNIITGASSAGAAPATAGATNVVAATTTQAAATTMVMAATTLMTGGGASNAPLPTSISNEDLSQSLSEYTDADESISAPTEFLAEFLSAVMLKDYKKALKYCKLILQYEPNNVTAKEFYPLIMDKLRDNASSDSDENYNKSSSPELALELQSSDPSAGESGDDQQPQCGEGELADGGDDGPEEHFSGELNSGESPMNSSSSGSPGDSLSDSISDDDDDEIDGEGLDGEMYDDDDEEDVQDDDDGDDDALSSCGYDLPVNGHRLLGDGSVADDINGSGNGSRNSSSGGEGRSRSDNTTHSYSSLLLEEEEEDDIVPVNLRYGKDTTTTDLDVSNGNQIPSASCSDSESPTEPLTQRLAAILLSKCKVSNEHAPNF